jgi:hypothetical protein
MKLMTVNFTILRVQYSTDDGKDGKRGMKSIVVDVRFGRTGRKSTVAAVQIRQGSRLP